MKLPTKQQCFDIWDKYQMPGNIRKHSNKVTQVADIIAVRIEEQGVDVNKELVNRGALLHDIAKIVAINKNSEAQHGIMGAEIIKKENLGNILAEIIRKHFLTTFNNQCTIEELIVNYADKRVTHDQIVSLEERFNYICSNYSKEIKEVEVYKQKYFDFENKYQLNQISLSE